VISAEEKGKLRFELANANVQSISRAQGLYISALLIYLCLAWGPLFTGNEQAVELHLGWLALRVDSIWRVTPFVTLVLTLAVIGTVTAALPASTELREAWQELFGSKHECMFALDTHKNLLDYLARLQLRPWGGTHMPADDKGSEPVWRRLHHLIFPALFLGSASTSYWAVRRLSGFCSSHHDALMIYGWSCLILQSAYSVRPTWRFLWRLCGAKRTSHVYN
jgi:hypothetical protein